MQFTRENRQDIHKYYTSTFVKFKQHALEKNLNADALFYIEHVDDSKVVGKCENGDPFIIWLSDKYPFEADYVLPHKSFFQFGPNACLLERVPAQQYFRGLHPENTQLTALNASGLVKKQTIGFESLKCFVSKRSFFTLSEAIDATDCNTCALSPRLQYSRPLQIILIDHVRIAKVDITKKVIFIEKTIFKEEIQDLLQATDEAKVFRISDSPVQPTPFVAPAVKKQPAKVTL